MTVLLIRRRRLVGEPDPQSGAAATATGAAAAPEFRVVDGTAGAGRICAALLELGKPLQRVRQAVVDADAPVAALVAIDIGARFDVVVLGSHLVNAPEPERRAGFLRVAAGHMADRGTLLVEHHPVDWAETAEDLEPTPGAALGMVDVRRHPPFVSAVSVFEGFGRVVRQPFTARVLSEAELATELGRAGLTVARRLGPTWLEATRAGVDAPLHRRRATRSLR